MSEPKGSESRPQLSLIENALSLRSTANIGPDAFTNTNPLWNPPWGRGIYGGAIIAQCLSAAQATVPLSFTVHSVHGYFIFAANKHLPIVYHVERLRDGKSVTTRGVRARQDGKCVFAATLSFIRQGIAEKRIEHAVPMPTNFTPPPDDIDLTHILSKAGQTDEKRPYDCVRCPVDSFGRPETRKLRNWIRARGPIRNCLLSDSTNEEGLELEIGLGMDGVGKMHHAHVVALAYMTDTYFIGTAARVHNASRFASEHGVNRRPPLLDGTGTDQNIVDIDRQRFFEQLAREELDENRDFLENDKHIGMMVSLDHTIYFHNPCLFRADEWMLMEMESPWAGNERALVVQRIWSKDGILVATCMQEGLVRLFQDTEKSQL